MKKFQIFAEENVITTAQITVNPREVDFVSSFSRDLSALTEAMGIARPIRKANGTVLVGKKASGTLENGEIPEGEIIPFSSFSVKPVNYEPIRIQKYAKAVTLEAIAEHGGAAVGMTDDEFKQQLIGEVLAPFYNTMLEGQLTSEETTWQMAVAMSIGRVKDKFKKMRKAATGVAVFANTIDVYAYLGGAEITTQTAFGMDYVKNFLGADMLFMSSEIPQGRVCATPVNNLIVYYVDPADNEFGDAGLTYTTDPDMPYIGYHVEGDYRRAQGESFAIMGVRIFAEYIDAIAVITVSNGPKLGQLTVTPTAGGTEGTTSVTVTGEAGTPGNVMKYKVSDAAISVVYGQSVRNWPTFTESTDIAASQGQTITVVEADQYYKAVGVGSNTVVLGE